MPALWSYPWTLAEEGLESTWSRFKEIGVDAVNIASHYHSVRSLQPRHPDSLFVQYPAGCYFKPDEERFAETPISPLSNDVPPFEDPLTEITTSAKNHGIQVNGWVVLCHNSRLGEANPDYRLESAFEDQQDHSLCPSHPEVREYFSAVVEEVAARSVNEIQIESLGFRPVLHGHGVSFGHDKRQVLTTQTEKILLSQCFCDGCRRAAKEKPVDIDAAQELVQDLLKTALAGPSSRLPALETLVVEYPVLRHLFDFRATVVTRLAKSLYRASGNTPLNYYVMDGGGVTVDDVWSAGVRLRDIDSYFDRVTALCYVRDPSAARQRIQKLESIVDCPVDVGITLDQDTISTREQLVTLLDGVRSMEERRLHVYHYSLMSDEHLEWIRTEI